MENIIPEFTIGYKTKIPSSKRVKVASPEEVFNVCREIFDADQIDWVESFIVIALNRSNRILGFYKVSSGGVSNTIADPKVIFQFALLSNASVLILAHNHPSGNVTPSQSDREMTRRLLEAGKLLDIKILDHMIVTSEKYYSFLEEGIL